MPTFGTKEAAERLGVSQATVSMYCRKGILKNAEQDRKGSPWHIPENSVTEYLQRKNRKNLEEVEHHEK